jgi:hypothetical protein
MFEAIIRSVTLAGSSVGVHMKENWSPTTRFVAGALGGIAMLNCVAKRTLPAMICGTAGFLLLVRAICDEEFAAAFQDVKGMRGIGSGAAASSAEAQSVPAGSNAPQGERDRHTIGSGAGGGVMSPDQLVDEASEESFPASDAPSFTR